MRLNLLLLLFLLISSTDYSAKNTSMSNLVVNDIKSNSKALTSISELDSCNFNGIPLYGKVKFVTSFPDIKIQFVESFPDIKVEFVSSFPDDCGQWQIVESFPDFTVQVVESFPDIKVKTVNSFPGI